MINLDNDLVVIGGTCDLNLNKMETPIFGGSCEESEFVRTDENSITGFSSSFYRFSCRNRICRWIKMPQKLNKPNTKFLAIPLPENFLKCNSEINW